MGWVFFILLNAVFFIRPGDLLESDNLPVYNIVIIPCMALAGGKALRLASSSWRVPVAACVLCFLAACVLSKLSHGNLTSAFQAGLEFSKVVIYYLLLVTLVDSPERLRSFLRWLVVFTVALAALALADHHGLIEIKSLAAYQQAEFNRETGGFEFFPRLKGTGVFGDPNDLSTILVIAITASLFFLETSARGRFFWLAPIGLLLYALKLTFSRGGLLNLGATLLILSWAKLGRKNTILLAFLAMPITLVLFGGRMTRIDPTSTEDTSQERIQLWAQGLEMFRESPIFGVGMNEYAGRAGLVAHNSFVHTYAELGFLGGTFFAGMFYAALAGVLRLANKSVIFYDRRLAQLRPYILGIICSYCAGIFSLSRPYTITTYLVLGIATAYLRIAETRTSSAPLRFDSQFAQKLLQVGVGCLAFLYLFTRFMVRWS